MEYFMFIAKVNSAKEKLLTLRTNFSFAQCQKL